MGLIPDSVFKFVVTQWILRYTKPSTILLFFFYSVFWIVSTKCSSWHREIWWSVHILLNADFENLSELRWSKFTSIIEHNSIRYSSPVEAFAWKLISITDARCLMYIRPHWKNVYPDKSLGYLEWTFRINMQSIPWIICFWLRLSYSGRRHWS